MLGKIYSLGYFAVIASSRYFYPAPLSFGGSYVPCLGIGWIFGIRLADFDAKFLP